MNNKTLTIKIFLHIWNELAKFIAIHAQIITQ